MTEKNLDPIDSEFISELTRNVTKAARSEGLVADATRDLAEKLNKDAENQKQIEAQILATSDEILSFGSSIINKTSNDFTAVNKLVDISAQAIGGLLSVIPKVGGVLDGLVKTVAEVTKFMVKSFGKAYTNFEHLADTGIVTTFTDLRIMSDATGIAFDGLDKTLSKHSKELAVFGGSVTNGVKKFQSIAASSRDLSDTFQKIGVSITDFTDYQLNYINQQTLAGKSQDRTEKQLIDGTKAYVEQLDTLAKLTGKNRKDIQSEMNSRMDNARFLAMVSAMPDTVQTTIHDVLTKAGQLGPNLEKPLIELFAGSGVATSDEARSLRFALGQGGLGNEFFDNVKRGLYSGDEASKMINHALAIHYGVYKDQATQLSSDSFQTKFIVEANKARLLDQNQTIKTKQDLIDGREKILKDTKGPNSVLAASRRRMMSINQRIDMMSTQPGVITDVLDSFSGGLSEITEQMLTTLGDKLPEYIKLSRDENKKQTELNKLRRDLNRKLQLEERLKDKNLSDEDKFNIEDELRDIRFKNLDWGKTIQEQIKVAESEIDEIKSKRTAAEKKEIDKVAGSSPGSSGTPTQPTGQTPSSSSGSQGASGASGAAGPTSASGSTVTPQAAQAEIERLKGEAAAGGTVLPSSVATGKEGWAQVYALAKAAGDPYPEVTASQWAVESGWGKHMSGKNNPFGQKAGPNQPGSVVNTREVRNGRSVMMDQKFRDYGSIQEAVSEHVTKWAPKYVGAKSPEAAIAMIASSYATGPDYANLVSSIIKQQKGAIPSAVAAAPAGANLGTNQASVMSGASTGYQAVLTGKTAVIPANSGSEASAVKQQTSDNDSVLEKTFAMISKKINKAIDVTKENTRNIINAVNV